MTPINIVEAPWFPIVLVTLTIIDLTLKMYTTWFAARRGQKVWFAILVLANTIGILPVAYLILHPVKKTSDPSSKKSR